MSNFPDTSPASHELAARAAAGAHSHWSPFDLTLEGSRFQRLHDIVSAAEFDADAAAETISQIIAFARGHGYGQADTYLNETHGKSDEDIGEDPTASIWRDDLFSTYDETEYFEYVTKSERILSEAAATVDAKAALCNLTVDALDAFCQGRDSCIEESKPKVSPAP